MKVKIIFMKGGLSLIGMAEDRPEDAAWVMLKPVQVVASPQGVQMIPIFEFVKEKENEEFVISDSEILFGGPKNPDEHLAETYVKKFNPPPSPVFDMSNIAGVLQPFELTTDPKQD